MRNEFTIYTDGSCNNLKEPNYGGWAYIILEDDNVIDEKSGNDIHTTNNRMEMTAIINSLANIPMFSNVKLFTDSKYCIGAFTKKHIGVETKNVDLIEMFHSIVEERSVEVKFEWVRGHNGNKYNEIVDDMANKEYEKISLDTLPDFKRVKKNKKKEFSDIDKQLMGLVSVIRFDTRQMDEKYLKDRVDEIKKIIYKR